jgi:peptidylprolyl isomerase
VNNIKTAISPLRVRAAALLTLLATGLLIAGCGSSGESSTITIGNENKADSKLVAQSAASAPKQPTSGPLASEQIPAKGTGARPTKLETKDIVTGTGKTIKKGDPISVNYVGVNFKTGKVFDSSWERKELFEFVYGANVVIPGWEKGMEGMKEGGRRELRIPASLAYGKKGQPKIPPEEALIFIVDLIKA